MSDWHSGRVDKSQFPDGLKEGDEVVCHLMQQKLDSKGFGTDVRVTNCRPA